MPEIFQTSSPIEAQTYFMQIFMLISNLASILTSEAAFQSTSRYSGSRFRWDDSIFLGHSKYSDLKFFYLTLMLRYIFCGLMNISRNFEWLGWFLGEKLQFTCKNVFFFSSKFELKLFSICCRNNKQVAGMANRRQLSHFILVFEVITYIKVKQINLTICLYGVEFVVSD